jgi:Arc/MetJ-type ribon-helix-helix transcriptional regulator
MVEEGKYQSISDALKAGIYELMREEQLKSIPWSSCQEVREYFAKKKRKLKGLEEIHDEED